VLLRGWQLLVAACLECDSTSSLQYSSTFLSHSSTIIQYNRTCRRAQAAEADCAGALSAQLLLLLLLLLLPLLLLLLLHCRLLWLHRHLLRLLHNHLLQVLLLLLRLPCMSLQCLLLLLLMVINNRSCQHLLLRLLLLLQQLLCWCPVLNPWQPLRVVCGLRAVPATAAACTMACLL
jgi:hypothetical protein